MVDDAQCDLEIRCGSAEGDRSGGDTCSVLLDNDTLMLSPTDQKPSGKNLS